MSEPTRAPSRVSKGVPTGGQFAASVRTESNLRLLPLRLDSLIPADRDYGLPATEVRSDVFDNVTISRIDGTDSFRVTGRASVDLAGGVFAHTTVAASPEEARTWLVERRAAVAEHLDRRYAATLSSERDSHDLDQIEVVTDVPCNSSLPEALEAIERAWGVADLREDLNGPTGGSLGADALYRGIVNAVERTERIVDEHAFGTHDDDPDPDECPECSARLSRLDDTARAMRNQEIR